VQAIFQNIPLHQLAAVRFAENQTTRSAAHELTQHCGQGLGQIHHPPVPGIRVPRFHVVLKLSALGFLDNLQGAEIFMDGTNVEAECFRGPHRPTAREQRIQRAIRFFGFPQNHFDFVLVNSWLILFVHLWSVDKAIVPISHEEWFAFYVPRRGHHGFLTTFT
jgi:hypothetical protein